MATIISLSGRDGILAAVPAILGFHPQESLVMTCLTGARRRVTPVIRLDLTTTPMDYAVQLADLGRRYADEVVLIAYIDNPAAELHDFEDLADHIAVNGQVIVLDVIRVPNCPVPIGDTLRAAVALHGRTILDNRAALTASAAYTGQPASPETLQLLHQTTTITGRDNLIIQILQNPGSDHLRALITAVQSAPDAHHATPELVAVLAVAAYSAGDGALAQVALDRILGINPNHRLAHLMIAAIGAGTPPAHLRTVLAP